MINQFNKHKINIWKTKVTYNITFEKLLKDLKEKTFEEKIIELNATYRENELTISCKNNMVLVNYDFLDFLSLIKAKLIDRIFIKDEQQHCVVIKTKDNKKYQIPAMFLNEDKECIVFNLDLIKKENSEEMEEN